MRGSAFIFAALLCAAPLAAQAQPSMQPPAQTFEGLRSDPVSIQFQVLNPPGGAAAGPFVITGTLPPGLTFNGTTGLLSGTLTTVGYYSFSVSRTYTFLALGGTQTVTGNYNFAVEERLVLLTPTPLPAATSGVAVTRTIQTNLNSYWDVGASDLPPTVGFSFPPGESGGTTLLLTGTFPPVSAPTTYTFVVYASAASYLYFQQSLERTYRITVNPPPRLSGPSPTATMGTPYASSLGVTGGTPGYSFAITGGALPPGLSLNALTGAIAGTPSMVGSFSFAVLVTDSSGASSTDSYSITVDPQPLSLPSSALPQGRVSESYGADLAATGGFPPYTYSLATGALPPGITLSSSGALRGVPTEIGTFSFAVRVFDARQNAASGSFVIQVLPMPLRITTTTLPSGQTTFAYSAALAAVGGVSPYSWSISLGSLPPGLSLSALTGEVSGTPAAAGTFSFTATVSDSTGTSSSRQFSLRIDEHLRIVTELLPPGMTGSAYSAPVSAAGGFPPYSWSASGALPPGLTLDAATGVLAGTPTTTGTFAFTVTVSDTAKGAASRAMTVRIVAPLRILTTTLAAGSEGREYAGLIAAEGGAQPYSFTLAAGQLPAGLTLSPGGSIAGTPSQLGSFFFTVRVTDNLRFQAEREFAIAILQAPRILTESLPDGRAGDAYSFTLTASGRQPLRWAITGGVLPPGLSLSPQTGAITGMPRQAGSFPLEITVSDGHEPPLPDRRAFTLRISQPSLSSLSITQLPETAVPATQPNFGLLLGQPFPLELNGTATLSFTPEAGLPADPAVRFASGGATVNFTIPAGQTAAVPAAGSLFALQTGTTAGVITIRVTLRLGNAVIAPDPFAVRTVRIPASGPQITRLVIVRNPAGFEIQVTGYSNIRQISGATFRFTPAPGATLGTAEISVPVAGVFQQWFAGEASRQFGGQFLLVVPFTLQGDASALASVQVTLTNSAGSGSAAASF